jgi:two-component system LytT family response regulator
MIPPMRVMIVDDEPLAREGLRLRLGREPDVEIVAECATAAAALLAAEELGPDVMFVDVQMPELDGFSMLESIERGPLPAVIFVTAYAEHALRAFRVRALDYLVKPFDDETFGHTVKRARDYVSQVRAGESAERLRSALRSLGADGAAPLTAAPVSHLRRLTVRTQERISFIEVDDVIWFEAARDYVKVHANGRAPLVRMTMTDLAAALDPARFARIHRTTIVALGAIAELQPYFRGEYVVVLRDGTKLRLSRRYRASLAAALGASF